MAASRDLALAPPITTTISLRPSASYGGDDVEARGADIAGLDAVDAAYAAEQSLWPRTSRPRKMKVASEK